MLAAPGLATLGVVSITVLSAALVVVLVVVVFILVTLLLAVVVVIVSGVLLMSALLAVVVAPAAVLAIGAIEGDWGVERTVRHSRRHCRSAGNVPAGHGHHRGTARTAGRRDSMSPGRGAGPGPDCGRSRRRSGLPADVRTSCGKSRVAMWELQSRCQQTVCGVARARGYLKHSVSQAGVRAYLKQWA